MFLELVTLVPMSAELQDSCFNDYSSSWWPPFFFLIGVGVFCLSLLLIFQTFSKFFLKKILNNLKTNKPNVTSHRMTYRNEQKKKKNLRLASENNTATCISATPREDKSVNHSMMRA